MAESTDKPVPEQDEASRGAWTRRELGGKTVWDWLQLLIVPIMLSLITVAFTWQQGVRQQRIENSRAEQARKIEEQRAQQATLQSYLDQMGTLLLDRGLDGAEEDSDVRRLARARTLVVLDALSSGRQNKVFRLLSETELIQAGTGDRPPIISLKYASLRNFEFAPPKILRPSSAARALGARTWRTEQGRMPAEDSVSSARKPRGSPPRGSSVVSRPGRSARRPARPLVR
jgi:hypothetical protein